MLQSHPSSSLEERLQRLEEHMARENPVLLEVVKSFRQLDQVAQKLGMIERDDSLATQISWWPVIAVLGTFSSGKSTFINHYLGRKLQLTGNQAVDDRFTVICWGPQEEPQVLPGIALDSDPRFAFYRISQDIADVGSGEAERLDSYLQLKTCNADKLKGKILIDSPGFDSDAQRAATLRIIRHIVDLSDLVLVFFDARHPEPGAMQQTLEHLVSEALKRPDFNKFLYILNQIDNTAREDNPEEVFAAWQRALAQHGLTAGRFYRIYDPEAATPIEDANLRIRFESKREVDAGEIYSRMHQVEIERAYRITGMLEQAAKSIRNEVAPRIREARQRWRQRMLTLDGVAFGALLVLLLVSSISLGWWEGPRFAPPWAETLAGSDILRWGLLLLLLGGAFYLHTLLRKLAARMVVGELRSSMKDDKQREYVVNGLRRNAESWRPALFSQPIGWGPLARRKVDHIIASADRFVQTLNDRFAAPSGDASEDKSTDTDASAEADSTVEPRRRAGGETSG